MGRKTVALSIDEELYEKYQAHCKEHFMVMSRKIEDLMRKDLENEIKK